MFLAIMVMLSTYLSWYYDILWPGLHWLWWPKLDNATKTFKCDFIIAIFIINQTIQFTIHF
jgi:hypothetical protein